MQQLIKRLTQTAASHRANTINKQYQQVADDIENLIASYNKQEKIIKKQNKLLASIKIVVILTTIINKIKNAISAKISKIKS